MFDQNKDGKIDNKDRVTLGSYIPNFNYGINLGVIFLQEFRFLYGYARCSW